VVLLPWVFLWSRGGLEVKPAQKSTLGNSDNSGSGQCSMGTSDFCASAKSN
jgi:hypothetical protein